MRRASLHRLAWLGVVLALVAPLTAQAGEGHDHGDAPAAPSANGPQRQPAGSVFLPQPAQRRLAGVLGDAVLGQDLREPGVEQPGRQQVDLDAVAADLAGQRLGEAAQRRLRRRVVDRRLDDALRRHCSYPYESRKIGLCVNVVIGAVASLGPAYQSEGQPWSPAGVIARNGKHVPVVRQ